MNYTYGLNEKYKENAINSQNELRKVYKKIIDPLREALRGGRYLTTGGLDKKHKEAVNNVLISKDKVRMFLRHTFDAVYLVIDTHYRTTEYSIEYIKHEIFLGNVNDITGNITLDEDTESTKAVYKTHAINQKYSVAGYNQAISRIRSYENQIKALESKIYDQRAKIRPFISN